MKLKLTFLFILILIVVSCNEYSKEKYPQSVIVSTPHTHIIRYHELEVDSLSSIPNYIQEGITRHLKSRLGDNKFSVLIHESTNIWSDKPIRIEESNSIANLLHGDNFLTQKTGKGIDTIYKYPLYASNFKLKIPEVGIEEFRFQIIADKNAEIIKDIEYPEHGFDTFTPINTIHNELIKRKISSDKLNIHLYFNEKSNSFIWSTNTLIRSGSITGPSCFPEVKQHFRVDAISGVITDYNEENNDEYISRIY